MAGASGRPIASVEGLDLRFVRFHDDPMWNRLILLVTASMVSVFVTGCSGGDDDDDGATTPAAPSGLVAMLMSNQPHLTWTDNADDEDGFSIERMVTGTGSFAEIATETFNIEQYHDMGAAAATSYTYRVMAMNGEGMSAPSNEVTIATP